MFARTFILLAVLAIAGSQAAPTSAQPQHQESLERVYYAPDSNLDGIISAPLDRRIVLLPGSNMHPIKTPPGTHILRREALDEAQPSQRNVDEIQINRLDPTRGGTFFGP